MHLFAAFLQESSDMPGAGFGLGFLIIVVAVYAFAAYCLQLIAQKTNTENGWFAWIPILNTVLMLNIAKKPVWWIILFFVPFVNIVILVIVMMAVAEARGKPGWWGILFLIPVVNLVILAMLAFSD